MESRADKAAELKRSGKCNCAQAIACTYCDFAGMDEKTMSDLAQGFGFGMGTLEGTCGSIIGAGIVLGAHNKDRRKTVQDMRAIMTEFNERNARSLAKLLKARKRASCCASAPTASRTRRKCWKKSSTNITTELIKPTYRKSAALPRHIKRNKKQPATRNARKLFLISLGGADQSSIRTPSSRIMSFKSSLG